ncbi:hypothetical protein [Pradoshia sp.]
MTLNSELTICLAKVKAIEEGLKAEAEHADNAHDAKTYRDAMLLVRDIKKDLSKRIETLGLAEGLS